MNLYFVIASVVILIVYGLYKFLKQRKYLKMLSEESFKEGYRKAQLIDVREPDEFKRGHILGARNIPASQMRQRLVEIRPDKPVYLYCQGTSRSARAAQLLNKKGYTDINILSGGFKNWTGKIK